jgi:hypothetical protein
MTDDIIDLGRLIDRVPGGKPSRGAMSLWGASGERSRFALPLWRVVHLAGADRAVLFWQRASDRSSTRPFIVLDMARDPARVDLSAVATELGEGESPELFDYGLAGVLVRLGVKDGRVWGLLADGRSEKAPLSARVREDIFFLSGECAGLLFLRSLAEDPEP